MRQGKQAIGDELLTGRSRLSGHGAVVIRDQLVQAADTDITSKSAYVGTGQQVSESAVRRTRTVARSVARDVADENASRRSGYRYGYVRRQRTIKVRDDAHPQIRRQVHVTAERKLVSAI